MIYRTIKFVLPVLRWETYAWDGKYGKNTYYILTFFGRILEGLRIKILSDPDDMILPDPVSGSNEAFWNLKRYPNFWKLAL